MLLYRTFSLGGKTGNWWFYWHKRASTVCTAVYILSTSVSTGFNCCLCILFTHTSVRSEICWKLLSCFSAWSDAIFQGIYIKSFHQKQTYKQFMFVFSLQVLIMQSYPHPNIVKTFGSYLVNDDLWVMMEYLDGGALTNIVSKMLWVFSLCQLTLFYQLKAQLFTDAPCLLFSTLWNIFDRFH